MKCNTSEHAWLEDRGPKLYLISMIDDTTSRIHSRFVMHDSTEENMRLLWSHLEKYGRPLSFYTDKASLFQTAPKVARDQKALARDEREPLPPTQIGRALQELDIVWFAAHSPQAKGRIERSFQTAQDRLVKGLRVVKACTLEQANAYLEETFLRWWNQKLTVVPASVDDAHRPLAATHSLAASRFAKTGAPAQAQSRVQRQKRASSAAPILLDKIRRLLLSTQSRFSVGFLLHDR